LKTAKGELKNYQNSEGFVTLF